MSLKIILSGRFIETHVPNWPLTDDEYSQMGTCENVYNVTSAGESQNHEKRY